MNCKNTRADCDIKENSRTRIAGIFSGFFESVWAAQTAKRPIVKILILATKEASLEMEKMDEDINKYMANAAKLNVKALYFW